MNRITEPRYTSSRLQIRDLLWTKPEGTLLVCTDLKSGILVIAKKLREFQCDEDMRSVLRELKIFRLANHANIARPNAAIIERDFDHKHRVYLVYDHQPFSLGNLLRFSPFQLTLGHTKYIIYQLLLIVHYLHSGSIMLLGLEPDAVSLSESSAVSLCSIGHARYKVGSRSIELSTSCSGYIAPEILFGSFALETASDMWSLGCIFYELLAFKPLLAGKDKWHNISRVAELFGTPGQDYWNYTQSYEYQAFVYSLGVFPAAKMSTSLKNSGIPETALHLLDSMLILDPRKRITVLNALKSPFFNEVFEATDLYELNIVPFDFAFETLPELTPEALLNEIFSEIYKINTD